EAVAVQLGRLLEYFRTEGAIADGDTVNAAHPLIHSTSGMLDNFCEAHWLTAQTLGRLIHRGTSQKALLDAIPKRSAARLLLGQGRRREGNSRVTLGNAISRYADMESIVLTAGKGRDRIVSRGPQFAELASVERRLVGCLHRA